jgi:hypothetical protein
MLAALEQEARDAKRGVLGDPRGCRRGSGGRRVGRGIWRHPALSVVGIAGSRPASLPRTSGAQLGLDLLQPDSLSGRSRRCPLLDIPCGHNAYYGVTGPLIMYNSLLGELSTSSCTATFHPLGSPLHHQRAVAFICSL